MQILILGGTGPSGILLIREALAASHSVVVYARSPQKLPDDLSSHQSVTIIKGELTEEEKLSSAIIGVDAILSALGPMGPSHPSDTPLARAYATVIREMKKHGVKRLIALGTASIKDENDKFSIIYTALITAVSLFANTAYKDIIAIGETIRTEGDGIDWTIVRVPLLTDRQEREVVAGYVGDGKVGVRLARLGFAAFVMEEVVKNEWVGKAPLLSSR